MIGSFIGKYLPLSTGKTTYITYVLYDSYFDRLFLICSLYIYLLDARERPLPYTCTAMGALAHPEEVAYGTLDEAKKAIDGHALKQGFAVCVLRTC